MTGTFTTAKINIPNITDGSENIVAERNDTDELLWGKLGYANAFRHNISIGMSSLISSPFIRMKSSDDPAVIDLNMEGGTFKIKNALTGHNKLVCYMPDIYDNIFSYGNVCVGASNSFKMKTKAGIPTDADLSVPEDGCIILDTTDNRLYIRSGGLWKYAALS